MRSSRKCAPNFWQLVSGTPTFPSPSMHWLNPCSFTTKVNLIWEEMGRLQRDTHNYFCNAFNYLAVLTYQASQVKVSPWARSTVRACLCCWKSWVWGLPDLSWGKTIVKRKHFILAGVSLLRSVLHPWTPPHHEFALGQNWRTSLLCIFALVGAVEQLSCALTCFTWSKFEILRTPRSALP